MVCAYGVWYYCPLFFSLNTQKFCGSDVQVEGIALRGLVLLGPTLSLDIDVSPPLTTE